MSVHWHDFPIGYFPPTTTPSCTFVTLWQLFDSIWLFGARQSNKQASDQANERRKSERTDGPSDNGSCWQNRVADSGRAWRGTVIWVSKIYKWKMWSLAAPAQDTAQGSEGQRGNTHINLILWQTKWTNIQLKMYYFKIVFFFRFGFTYSLDSCPPRGISWSDNIGNDFDSNVSPDIYHHAGNDIQFVFVCCDERNPAKWIVNGN